MSSNESASTEEGDSGPGTREVAYRLFATEFDDAEFSYSESDEERAPNYVVTPTGLRVNRLFAVGVLTEVESVNPNTVRGRIVDPTGAFVTYAGQYQPEAQAFLDSAASPSFVALTGKARTFEPDDGDQIFTSVRPESLSEVTADTRDRWTVSAAEATLDRIAVFAKALDSGLTGNKLQVELEAAGVDRSVAAGIPRAIEYYGTTTAYLEALRQAAVDALELVAGEREDVRSVDVAPGEGGSATLGPLPAVDIEIAGASSAATAEPSSPTPKSSTETAGAATESAETGESAELEESAESEEPEEPEEPEGAVEGSTEAAETATETTTAASSDTPTADSSTAASEPDSETPAAEVSGESAPTGAGGTEESDGDIGGGGDATSEGIEAEDEPDLYQLEEEEREELKSEFGAEFESGNDVDPAGEADIDVPDADEVAAAAEADAAEADAPEATKPTGETETAEGKSAAETEPAETATETAETGAETAGTTTETADQSTTADTTSESATADTGTDLGSFNDTAASDQSTAEATEATDTSESTTATADTAESTTATTDTTASATESTDTSDSTTEPADTDASTDINLEDAAIELMEERDRGDGADRGDIVATIAEQHGVEGAAVEDAIDDALMSGRCYEPDDGVLKPI